MTAEREAGLQALREAVGEALHVARGLSDAECRLVSASEGWPLVLVAYHIGLGLRRQAGWIARALTGEAPFAFDWEATHEINEINAREHGRLPKSDAIRGIEDGWGRLRAVIERMSLADWDRDVFAFGGRVRSADVVLRRIVLPHVSEHLDSIRRTLATAGAG